MSATFRRCLLAVFLPLSITSAQGKTLDAWLDNELDALVTLYRDFHRSPELSYKEAATAKKVAALLTEIGVKVSSGIGGHGVVGILENGEGRTLMLRTDLDALPLTEKTGLDFASKVRTKTDKGQDVGVMHACGHDLHMTNLIGVARFLAANKKLWRGRVMFLGQPAEERGGGAKAMLEDGLFKRFPKPDAAIALHVHPGMATGTVGYRLGYAMANVDSVDITLFGKGGHGAYPHTTIDPIVQAAQLIVNLQSIVSREVSPLESAVITVGSIHGGAKHNIIGDRCHLQLTVRSYTDAVRKHLKAAIVRKAKAIAAADRAPEPLIRFSEAVPALFNDEKLIAAVLPAMKRALGKSKVIATQPVMGAEDFARYGRAGVPVFMFRLGSITATRLAAFRKDGETPPSLHSPFYYPDAREALRTGIKAMVAAAIEYLKPK